VLTALRLENIALIERLELTFSAGFTVLTGETGAGKSILLDALDAVAGGGQPARLLRTGANRAEIEAAFTFTSALREWCATQVLNLETEDELLLSREIRKQDDRLISRSRLNGVSLSKALLTELRPLLLDLTGQGITQHLGRPGQQRRWLDRCGGASLQGCLAPVRLAHKHWKQAKQALGQARAMAERNEQQRQAQEQLLQELEAAQLQDPLERQQLEQEQDRLCHGVRLQQGCAELQGRLLEGAEAAPAVFEHLAACDQEIQVMLSLDGSLLPFQQRWLELHGNFQLLVQELDRYASGLEADPEQLANLQDRIALLKGLERRHGQDLRALIQQRDQLRDQLLMGGPSALIEKLEAEELQIRLKRDQACAALSKERRKAAQNLEQQIMQALRPMALPAVRFAIGLQPSDPTEEGAETVEFLFSANPGEPLAPLQEVASGGEMSRFLLALKTCLAEGDGGVTLVFDEIDSGVSGKVSVAMADLLKRLARHRQVLTVTHQAVVAAAADQHLLVRKQVENGITRTVVERLLDAKDRERELAELVGGDSGEARRFAASLLQKQVA
jgi:DNA repair protein RecN (Recombination protein N)